MRLTLSSLHLPKGLNGEQYFHIERIQGREYINQLFEYHVVVYVTDELGHPVH